MDTPRSGFRRAAVTSWALVGIGVAGVAGASSLAYADTFKPAATQNPFVAAVPDAPPEEPGPPPTVDIPTVDSPTVDSPPVPEIVTTTPAPPPVVGTEAPVPTYTREQTVERTPAPVTREATVPPTTKRRPSTPTTVMAPNYSPHVTVSRGS